MDKILNSTFDFFNYALPGVCMLLSLLILDPAINTLADILAFSATFNTGGIVMLIAFGFMTGFALTPIGNKIYQLVGYSIWRRRPIDNTGMSMSDKYVLVRQESPANFKYIETWNMLCGMSHNLAVVAIVSAINIAFKLLWLHPPNLGFWCMAFVGVMLLFISFLRSAVRFREWAIHDLVAAVKLIQERK